MKTYHWVLVIVLVFSVGLLTLGCGSTKTKNDLKTEVFQPLSLMELHEDVREDHVHSVIERYLNEQDEQDMDQLLFWIDEQEVSEALGVKIFAALYQERLVVLRESYPVGEPVCFAVDFGRDGRRQRWLSSHHGIRSISVDGHPMRRYSRPDALGLPRQSNHTPGIYSSTYCLEWIPEDVGDYELITTHYLARGDKFKGIVPVRTSIRVVEPEDAERVEFLSSEELDETMRSRITIQPVEQRIHHSPLPLPRMSGFCPISGSQLLIQL